MTRIGVGRRGFAFKALCFSTLCLFAIGCGGSLPGTDLPDAREVAPALEFPELRDYRGIVDCRMKQSGFDQVKLAELARNAQIDFVALGDYVKPDSDFGIGGFTSSVLFIPGATFKIGHDGAEIVALNLTRPIDYGDEASAIIGRIHDQHAVAIAANLSKFKSPDDYALADAVEIYNIDHTWNARSSSGMYLRSIFFGADRLFGSLDIRPDADLASYDQMIPGARVTLLAGLGAAPDASVMGTHVGTFEQLFEIYTTHILATERQVDPIIDALKHGHSYVSFDFLGYVPSFAFFAQVGDRKIIMGDQIESSSGLKLKVETPAVADKIVIIGNGAEVTSAENVSNFEFTPTAPGQYRVEAIRGGHPWIYSNPIYVR